MDLPITRIPKYTTFELVSKMNTAFGNPKGDPTNIAWPKISKQCANIFDEYCELLIALGVSKDSVRLKELRTLHMVMLNLEFNNLPAIEEVRDALCDIQVFAAGAQHLMGVDGDRDMQAVIDGVMTRFVKDEADLQATLEMHHAKGVTSVYTEGDYPTVIVKSAMDQPDAPQGKFLKSASYKPTQFYSLDESK